jgi:hypothetical protein
MTPKWHILFGFMASALFYRSDLLSPKLSLIVFIASFMIDTDHYLWYVWRTKTLNPITAVRWFFAMRAKALQSSKKVNESYEKPFYLLHWWLLTPLLLVMGILYSPEIFAIGLGFGIHLLLDLAEILWYGNVGYAKFFPLESMRDNRGKKNVLRR